MCPTSSDSSRVFPRAFDLSHQRMDPQQLDQVLSSEQVLKLVRTVWFHPGHLCKVGYYCSLQGSLLGTIDGSFPPLVECSASSIMRTSP